MSLSPAVPGTDAVAVRIAPAGTPPHDLLRELGAGRVTRRPGRAPLAENGHVSVSRTDGLVAVALADRPVGIDVERVRPLPDLDQLVRDHLGAGDAAAVRAAPDPTRAFYAVWTGLEALLKAEGVGIVDGLDPSPELRARWQVLSVDVGADHSAALAVPSDSFAASNPTLPGRSSPHQAFGSFPVP
ncbi:4'-phosphopantetheinyl transferase family protein [Nocardioides okcheonensis]|uniref:4'-phosphopantetheinyl transferase family protein n=1 Tax=Nocardioides okcheonensis TaxID=2894081 RepID=UPI001E53FB5C|nr:4'-phosphopantetheinyl transferase superfamily protein [Nocardioides okcheonensis]UFN45104.1 4'-phosphopantetheinyl transferase superfamily protein [Nocardioides okcheonensis]